MFNLNFTFFAFKKQICDNLNSFEENTFTAGIDKRSRMLAFISDKSKFTDKNLSHLIYAMSVYLIVNETNFHSTTYELQT